MPYPNISVEGQRVVFKYSFDENDVKQPGWHDKVMAQAKQDVGSIKRGLVPVNSDVEAANHDFVRTIRSAIIAKKFISKCHTASCTCSLTKRTCRAINSRNFFHIRMSLKNT